MPSTHRVTRREFNAAAALALLGGATVTVSGCGGSSPAAPTAATPPPAAPPPAASAEDDFDGVVGTISSNTGHSARITRAELTEGDELALDIQGEADHPHFVFLSADEVVRIRDGARVVKQSSTDFNHSHEVAFN